MVSVVLPTNRTQTGLGLFPRCLSQAGTGRPGTPTVLCPPAPGLHLGLQGEPAVPKEGAGVGCGVNSGKAPGRT